MVCAVVRRCLPIRVFCLATETLNLPATKRVFDCDGQIIDRLFRGWLEYDDFELGVGRNIAVSGTF